MRGSGAIGWAGAALAAALLGACGDAGSGPDAAAPRSPTLTGAVITIDAPEDGSRLRAREAGGGALARTVRVRGRGPAGSAVVVSAACRPRPCSARAKAGADGRWSASMRLTAPRAAGFVSIDASAQNGVVRDGSAVATVELVGARRAASAKRGSASTASRRASESAVERRAREGSSAVDPLARGGSSAVDPAGRDGSSAVDPPARDGSAVERRAGDDAARAPARRVLPRDVLVIGDSLATGTAEALPAALPGWRVRTDSRIARPLAEGMRILAGEGDPPAVLAFSLFTNDDPRGTAALESAVRSTATRPGGCAVWATVVRPPLEGVSYQDANSLLRRLAADADLSLQLVDWSAEVASSPSLIAGDGVHASPAGYRVRAQLFARAIRACAGR